VTSEILPAALKEIRCRNLAGGWREPPGYLTNFGSLVGPFSASSQERWSFSNFEWCYAFVLALCAAAPRIMLSG